MQNTQKDQNFTPHVHKSRVAVGSAAALTMADLYVNILRKSLTCGSILFSPHRLTEPGRSAVVPTMLHQQPGSLAQTKPYKRKANLHTSSTMPSPKCWKRCPHGSFAITGSVQTNSGAWGIVRRIVDTLLLSCSFFSCCCNLATSLLFFK